MLDVDSSRLALKRIFDHRPVADLAQLARTLGTNSRMSIFRRLSLIGYRSSYSHTGRYYTLTSLPNFDTDGLWRYEGIGFSSDGTLKATVLRLVVTSDAGCTQNELQLRLGVRVHNTLLDLVEERKIGREDVESEYLYVTIKRSCAKEQVERHKTRVMTGVTRVPPSIEVEVLVEVIHGMRVPPPTAAMVAERLKVRGIFASVSEVATVLAKHGFEKKRVSSRFVRSRH